MRSMERPKMNRIRTVSADNSRIYSDNCTSDTSDGKDHITSPTNLKDIQS
jgi:hypothetical protein